jgi:hypothetical protein
MLIRKSYVMIGEKSISWSMDKNCGSVSLGFDQSGISEYERT